MPGTGKAFTVCNAKKVRCSYLGVKPLDEIIILSKEEGTTPKPQKAKMSGVVPKAGKVSVEIGKLANSSAEILKAIRQQNSLLGELLGYQQQTAIASQMRLAHDEISGLDCLGFGGPKLRDRFGWFGIRIAGEREKGKGKGKAKEQGEIAKNRSGNRDGDGDRNEDRNEDADRNRDETLGKSM
jgi:hypothetical protein